MVFNNFVFPYKNVKKGSHIVIYGLGMVGECYIEQIRQTEYCQIVAVSDRNEDANSFGYLYIRPNGISTLDFDVVVIAIDSWIVSASVIEMLRDMDIHLEKIITGYQVKDRLYEYCYHEKKELSHERRLRIAVAFRGGLGDYVVLLSFIRRLITIEPNIILDLYGIGSFLEAVFESEGYISQMIDDEDIQFRLHEIISLHDVVIQIVQFPLIIFCDRKIVSEISPALLDVIRRSENDLHIKDLQMQPENHLSIYHRAKLLHFNRYRFLGQGDIWDLKVSDSCLYTNDNFKELFENLELNEKYITFNYGASRSGGSLQTKVWPQKHYEKLIKKIHKRYPEIQIVQLGDRFAPEFTDADVKIIDADLRLVKHVLKNSMVHIDGEGALVHMATQLGTRCIVMFGPTPEWYYGYPQNENIVSEICSDCCHLFPGWYSTCILGDDIPRCMSSINPDRVMESLEKILNEKE